MPRTTLHHHETSDRLPFTYSYTWSTELDGVSQIIDCDFSYLCNVVQVTDDGLHFGGDYEKAQVRKAIIFFKVVTSGESHF